MRVLCLEEVDFTTKIIQVLLQRFELQGRGSKIFGFADQLLLKGFFLVPQKAIAINQGRILFNLRQEHLSITRRKRSFRRLSPFLPQGKWVIQRIPR